MASLLAKELMARQLQIEISRNNKALLNGLLQMEKRRNENKFLETVYQDYKRYHDYIIKNNLFLLLCQFNTLQKLLQRTYHHRLHQLFFY